MTLPGEGSDASTGTKQQCIKGGLVVKFQCDFDLTPFTKISMATIPSRVLISLEDPSVEEVCHKGPEQTQWTQPPCPNSKAELCNRLFQHSGQSSAAKATDDKDRPESCGTPVASQTLP